MQELIFFTQVIFHHEKTLYLPPHWTPDRNLISFFPQRKRLY